MSAIKAITIDGQRMFVQGLLTCMKQVKTPAIKFIACFDTSEDAMEFLGTDEVDIIFMELNLPDIDGLELIPSIKEQCPNAVICILSSYSDSKFVKEALQRGADGFVSKSNSVEDLCNGILEMRKGHTFLGEGLRITPSNKMAIRAKKSTKSIYEDKFLIKQRLTRREQEILELITEAKNNREIAEELFISDQTVGVHRKNIMRKLGVRNTVNLIKYALEYQLV